MSSQADSSLRRGAIAQLARSGRPGDRSKMFYVYVLKSQKNGRLYTGSTRDVSKRLLEHNSGKSKATRFSRPFELIHQESYNTRAEAYNREMYLKTGVGREELNNLLNRN